MAWTRPSLAHDWMRDGLDRDWHAPFPLSLRLTLLVHRRGPGDPTFRVDERGAIWRTSLTPDGPGTLRLVRIRTPAGETGLSETVATGR